MNGPLLDRGKMLAAFALLDERLGRRNVIAQIHVIGGAAMSLAWEDRRTTRDVDALFETDRHGVLIEEIHGVADDLNLPKSWLNEQATYYAPAGYRSNEGIVFDGHHLQVAAASAEVVLAMKVRAARPGDIEDIRILLSMLGLEEFDAVLEVHDRYFPGDPLPAAKQMVLEDLLR